MRRATEDHSTEKEVKTAVKDIEIVLTEALAGDHNASGSIEVAARDEKRQSRALLSDLEENLGKWKIRIGYSHG